LATACGKHQEIGRVNIQTSAFLPTGANAIKGTVLLAFHFNSQGCKTPPSY
jgi:hypothetical protein